MELTLNLPWGNMQSVQTPASVATGDTIVVLFTAPSPVPPRAYIGVAENGGGANAFMVPTINGKTQPGDMQNIDVRAGDFVAGVNTLVISITNGAAASGLFIQMIVPKHE